jgi:D-alanyl-D-alanine carboxypeptidase/D-alanyl-D-alanine-endopeptidase (penicillin-binding protein 4)
VRRLLIGVLALLLLAGGYAAADATDVAPGFLTLSAARPAEPSTSAPAPTISWPATDPAQAVLVDPSDSAPMPTPAGLARQLSALVRAFGKTGGADVVDVATGQTLYAHGASAPRTPASTTKLLTAAAVLTALGPDATLSTKVVRGARSSQIILVGGGDTHLATGAGSPTAVFGRAGIGDLATATAKALQDNGVSRVSLGFDDSLFSGPRLSPHWEPSDYRTGLVGPVTALGLAAKAATPRRPAPADPSLAAAQAFAAALTRSGVAVAGTPRRVRAAPAAPSLAVVQSAPLSDIVAVTLDTSDNTEAEVLARLGASAAGGPGSFVGAAAHNLKAVAALGVPVTGIRLYDGSGLARTDLIPPQTLTTLLTKVATSDQPGMRAIFAGLPVAGYTGTLVNRFQDRLTRGGAGVVRAKTGTLKGVNTLAGVTVDADGRLLAFAFMADHRTPKLGSARELVDRAASTLAACGCR